MSNWRDMADAPRSGQHLLGWDPKVAGGYIIFHWSAQRQRWMRDLRLPAWPVCWTELVPPPQRSELEAASSPIHAPTSG